MEDITRDRRVAEDLRRVAQDFQRLGNELSTSANPNPFQTVATLALERMPTAYAASITTHSHGRFMTAAATDEVARRADALQYELGSGPCLDAIVDDAIYQPKTLLSTSVGPSTAVASWRSWGCAACCRTGCTSRPPESSGG
ncbi:hypothetical protein [Terrabacter sp. NPDC080008]|uniref:hypothetical protein n=1 Tax=Terrabacter sp. NPDC080008 TaxID=3155176 RepID=UPI00344F34D3